MRFSAVLGLIALGAACDAPTETRLSGPHDWNAHATAAPGSYTSVSTALWNLDRIDQRLGFDGKYTYAATGAGVRVYVIDGKLDKHELFRGRVLDPYVLNFQEGTSTACDHATQVAGVIGADIYGVARLVEIKPIQATTCGSGSESDLVKALSWIRENHPAGMPGVVNISLKLPTRSETLDDTARALIASGLTLVVAAGNENLNACDYSPSGLPEAITVGATNSSDSKATSNWGPCVDIWAPGAGIRTTTGITGTAINSGTSFAAPHVTGVVALMLHREPWLTPAEVWERLCSVSTVNVVGGLEGTNSPNRFLYSLPAIYLEGCTKSVQPKDTDGWQEADGGALIKR